jgi:hypothetical protein
VEDTEIVHAAAPGAAIREVLISDKASHSPIAASAGLAAALRLGLTQGAMISFSHSWGALLHHGRGGPAELRAAGSQEPPRDRDQLLR